MKKSILFIVALMALSLTIWAQENHPNSKEGQALSQPEGLLGGSDIDILVINVLADNGMNYFNAPNVPRFTIVGKDRSYYLGIGGYVRGTMSFDYGNPIDNANLFVPSLIPDHLAEGNSSLLQFSGAVSNLVFNFVALPHTDNSVGAYINFNFDGPNNYLTLQNAYLKYRGFKAGYTSSLFTDVMSIPPTIDFQGPNSLTFLYNALIDYEYEWGENWSVGAGLEMPIASYTTSDSTYSVYQSIPDIPLYLQYAWNKRSSWVRLSTMFRNITYRDEVTDHNRDRVGWGVKLSGSATFDHTLTAYYQAIYGEGISNYIQDMAGLGLDLLPSATHVGDLEANNAWGGYLGLQYNFTKSLFASATYSLVRTWRDEVVKAPTQYENAQYIVANLFWTVAPQVQLGIEYLWGDREDADAEKYHNNRLQTMIQVNF